MSHKVMQYYLPLGTLFTGVKILNETLLVYVHKAYKYFQLGQRVLWKDHADNCKAHVHKIGHI